jgi:hypothetical protein
LIEEKFCLDFADQIEAWFEGVFAWTPFGRADLTFVGSDKLGGLDFAQEFIGVAANAVVVDFGDFYLALWVDDESAAVSKTFFVNVDPKRPGQMACRIGEHWIFDFFDGLRRVVPSFVDKVGVGGYGVDFDAEFLEFGVFVGHIPKLGGAHKGEVGGVKEKDGPFTFEVITRHGFEIVLMVGLDFELWDF